MDNGKQTTNKYDNYLKFKSGQIFRNSKDTLSIYFLTTNAMKKYIPLLEDAKVSIKEHVSGDSEYIYHFPERQLSTVADIVHITVRGKHKYPNFE
jgi:hypothetical protein